MSTKNEIATLAKMKVNELQAKFADVIGEKTRSSNKTFLMRRITEALQAKAPTDATGAAAKPSTPSPGKARSPATEKLTRLDMSELQALYLEAVGRPTGSANKAYLIWKIREAKKGRIPGRSGGIKNRTEFFRGALGHYLRHLGAADAAALFGDAKAA